MVFHELTGINVILAYSNTILKNILGDKTSGFNARTGTYAVGVVNLLSSFVSIFAVRSFGRKSLLLVGHVGIFIAHLLVAIFTLTGTNAGVLAMICFFLFAYQNSSGPIAWLYAAETCCDVGLAVSLNTLWGTVLVL